MNGFYGLVQFVPRPDRGEAINVGLVLASEEKKVIAAKFRHKFPESKKLSYLTPNDHMIASFERYLKKTDTLNLDQLSHDLSNSVKIYELHPCSFEDPRRFLGGLFQSLVLPPRKSG
jgi:hypothetical protein